MQSSSQIANKPTPKTPPTNQHPKILNSVLNNRSSYFVLFPVLVIPCHSKEATVNKIFCTLAAYHKYLAKTNLQFKVFIKNRIKIIHLV